MENFGARSDWRNRVTKSARVHFKRKFAMSITTAPTLFCSSVKNKGLGLVLAGILLFVLCAGGFGAIYGDYVQTVSAQVSAASSSRV